ncbi:MAG: MBL fold metallo-hydrolase [Candidatus Saccharimonadales bacterium]
MKITKYEHACLVIEDGGKKLVIDPGMYAESLPKGLDNVSGIVITHVHKDHFSPQNIQNIVEHNPDVEICTTQEVADELKNLKVHVVDSGLGCKAGSFELEFFGGKHAVVHKSIPINQNVGVMVNSKFYYPGDSFTLPERPVEVLAVPSGGPWMKAAEAIDFMLAVKPKNAFPTHNIHLSEEGQKLADWLLGEAAANANIGYRALLPGDSTEC